jgi:hypothetical protein
MRHESIGPVDLADPLAEAADQDRVHTTSASRAL